MPFFNETALKLINNTYIIFVKFTTALLCATLVRSNFVVKCISLWLA
jgi:hypothetical protein